jgi:hypothetical protein
MSTGSRLICANCAARPSALTKDPLVAQMGKLHVEIVESEGRTRIWNLCLFGIMIGAMAHGFHWI